jgi:hypothetical protein
MQELPLTEMLLTLSDEQDTVHVLAHSGLVDIATAALSTDPETIDDLRIGMQRYLEEDVVEGLFARVERGCGDARSADGTVIIDVPGRLINTSLPPSEIYDYGTVAWCDHVSAQDVWLPYRFEGWQILHGVDHWQQVAEGRRQERRQHPPLEARRVLYDDVAYFLASRWKQQAASLENPVSSIQSSWLLTPHEGLAGRTPREVLLSRREFLDGDIEDVGAIWTILGKCPPGLPSDCHAYRYGRFGTHEIILYHDMVTYLLTELKQQHGAEAKYEVDVEARRLDELREEWLHTSQDDLCDQSPAALIAANRARLPWVIPRDRVCLDDNCPLCQMMAESDQPAFWHLDGYLLADEFATSFHETREEWEAEQAEMREWAENLPEFTSAEVENADHTEPRIWNSTFTNMNLVRDLPTPSAIGMMLFSIGGHLAELSIDLGDTPEAEPTICSMQSRFAALRRAVEDESSWTVNLIVAQFAEELQGIAALHPGLRPKCDDLEKKIDYLGQLCTDVASA